jgi:hypothetical protein
MSNDGIYAVRCKIEFTRLDLATGLEKEIKYTSEIDLDETDYYGTTDANSQALAKQINKWLNDDYKYILSNMKRLSCKVGYRYIHYLWKWIRETRWKEYKKCDNKDNDQFISYLDNSDTRIGYNVNSKRLIQYDYEDYCDTYMEDLGEFS